MATEEKKDEGKGKELESIFIEAWADWKGARVARDIRTGDGQTKFTVSLPVVENDEQAKQIYGTTLQALLVKGCKQHSYDKDTNLATIIAGWLKDGADMKTKADEVAITVEEDFSAPDKERKGESAEEKASRKELEKIKKENKMTYAEMLAKIKAAGL